MNPKKQALIAKSKADKAKRKSQLAKSKHDMGEITPFIPLPSQLGDLKSRTHVAFNPMRKTRFEK